MTPGQQLAERLARNEQERRRLHEQEQERIRRQAKAA
jgi:hypothetical protein